MKFTQKKLMNQEYWVTKWSIRLTTFSSKSTNSTKWIETIGQTIQLTA